MGMIFGYPKNPAQDYTGCLHVWIAEDAEGRDWGLKMTTYFVSGQPKIYIERIQERGKGEGEVTLECRYDGKQVVFQRLHPDGSASEQCPVSSLLEEALRGKPNT
jgi:hypothetical protein